MPPPSPGDDAAAATGDPLISGGFVVACLVAIAIGGGAGFAVAAWRRREG